jgi:predicted DNA-binding transcriptional regulator YafY
VTQAKTERLVNLTLALMAAPRFLTVAELGRLVQGYEPDGTDTGGDAFRRMFERDKEELRELGIPLQTGPVDALWADELGYRIARSDYALPEITLDPDEAAALGLAARLWSSAELAEATSSALTKLSAAGIEPIPPPVGLEARLDASEPSFGALYDAVATHREVRFGYRRPGGVEAARRLQPWGLTSWRGRWYVAGQDLDRQAPRVFRLSRITSPVAGVGAPGAYQPPVDLDVRSLVMAADPDDPPVTGVARIRVVAGAGQRLRHGATQVGSDPDLLDVPFADLAGFADLITSYGPDAVVEGPPQLRSLVVDRLTALAGTSS